VSYSGTVRVKAIVDVLREYEAEFVVADAAADLPESLSPDTDAIGLDDLAEEHGVSVEALEDKTFPDHERIGRTLVRPAVLETVGEELEAGMSLSAAEEVLDDYGIDDASAALSRLGFRVAWGARRRDAAGEGRVGASEARTGSADRRQRPDM